LTFCHVVCFSLLPFHLTWRTVSPELVVPGRKPFPELANFRLLVNTSTISSCPSMIPAALTVCFHAADQGTPASFRFLYSPPFFSSDIHSGYLPFPYPAFSFSPPASSLQMLVPLDGRSLLPALPFCPWFFLDPNPSRLLPPFFLGKRLLKPLTLPIAVLAAVMQRLYGSMLSCSPNVRICPVRIGFQRELRPSPFLSHDGGNSTLPSPHLYHRHCLNLPHVPW